MIVMDYQGRGWSAEEIARQYAYLTLAEVHAALAYYHDHSVEIDQELEAESAEVERLRRTTPESPLLKRLRALKAQMQHQGEGRAWSPGFSRSDTVSPLIFKYSEPS